MLSPQEANTTIGERMLRRSTRCLPSNDSTSPDGELVADEEVLRDPLHLLLVHEVVAAPPLLELEEPLALGVDLGVQVVELGPVGVRRVEVLEVVDEIRAVELAVAEVARHRGHPRPAHQPARVAHRVLAGDAGPVGDRRAGEQDRPDLVAAPAPRASSAPSRPGSCRSRTACPRRPGAARSPCAGTRLRRAQTDSIVWPGTGCGKNITK